MLIALADLPPQVRMNKDNIVTVLFGQENPNHIGHLFKPLISLFTRLLSKGLKLQTPTGDELNLNLYLDLTT